MEGAAALTSSPLPLPPTRSSLLGAWRLVSWTTAAGEPFGPHPTGQLQYTADGQMSALLSARHRGAWATSALEGTAEERLAAFDSFRAYSGRFAEDTDAATGAAVVRHHVEVCNFPGRVGTTLSRYVELSDGGRTLTLRPVGAASADVLVWRRVS